MFFFYLFIGTPKRHHYHDQHLIAHQAGDWHEETMVAKEKQMTGALMSLHSSAHLSANIFTVEKTASEVSAPLTISTSFIIGGGFIKCIPITYRWWNSEVV